MAHSVKATGVSTHTGALLLEMELPWWDADQLVEDDRFAISKEAVGYLDYDAELTVDEMRMLHERFRLAATSGVFAFDEWQKVLQPRLEALDQILYAHTDAPAVFHVSVFEWDSGLG